MKRPLKIVHVSRYYKMGGAAKAALRLHDALLEKGVESIFMSLDEDMNDSLHQINLRTYYNKPENLYYRIFNKIKRVISRHIKNSRAEIIEELKEILSQIKSEFVSLPFSDYRLEEHPAIKSADIIHLHWVADEMLDYQRFFSVCKKPVVWTLHDMNPIQGLFHYENDTIFNRKVAGRLDDKVLNIKIGAIRSFKKRIFIATPSEWLTKKVKESKIFNGLLSTTIPNSLDQTVFCLRSQNEIREELGLPLNEIIILFAAESLENFRKGFDLLIESLLLVKNTDLVLVILGGDNIYIKSNSKMITTGRINDESLMAKYYAAADAFIIPSREDNLPNVMLEALSCGTPIIGFPVGGIKEHIQPFKTGILANEITATALTTAIETFINSLDVFDASFIRNYAVSNFNTETQIHRYLQVYEKLIENE